MWSKVIAACCILFLSISSTGSYLDLSEVDQVEIDKEAFVSRHNFYRSKVGAPDIHWNDSLALYAQTWANYLAKRCELEHSDGGYGENIYWQVRQKQKSR